MTPPPAEPSARDLAERVVVWFRANARALPWRSDPTPYKVLLSELMLQQTRVDTVIERFEAFVARWPSLGALADAEEDDVLRAWAGLGYYARARNLHRAARAAHAAGGLPSDPRALRALPGVGPYTAGAIASIAFGVAAPIVDGNVERVLSRVDGREADPRSAAGRRALWARAEALVAHADPSALNQGLMELGALVCTPRSPACGRCPWAEVCVGRARGIASELPRKAPPKPPRPVRGVAGLLVRDGAVLLGQRPRRGLLGGLWEPIGTDLAEGEAPADALVAAFARRAGLAVRLERHVGTVVHVFSHRKLTLEVFAVSEAGQGTASASDGYQRVRWVGAGATDEVGLSTLAVRTLALLDGAEAQIGLFAADG